MNKIKYTVSGNNYIKRGDIVRVYVAIDTTFSNPLELKEEIDNFIKYIEEKYDSDGKSRFNVSFKQWLLDKIKITNKNYFQK